MGGEIEAPWLNAINSKLIEFYNTVKSDFASGVNGYFEFAFQTFFGEVDELEARYIQIALDKIHEIVKHYRQKQQEKAEYYTRLREKIGNERNGASVRGAA